MSARNERDERHRLKAIRTLEVTARAAERSEASRNVFLRFKSRSVHLGFLPPESPPRGLGTSRRVSIDKSTAVGAEDSGKPVLACGRVRQCAVSRAEKISRSRHFVGVGDGEWVASLAGRRRRATALGGIRHCVAARWSPTPLHRESRSAMARSNRTPVDEDRRSTAPVSQGFGVAVTGT
jgi:hypothetical protein